MNVVGKNIKYFLERSRIENHALLLKERKGDGKN